MTLTKFTVTIDNIFSTTSTSLYLLHHWKLVHKNAHLKEFLGRSKPTSIYGSSSLGFPRLVVPNWGSSFQQSKMLVFFFGFLIVSYFWFRINTNKGKHALILFWHMTKFHHHKKTRQIAWFIGFENSKIKMQIAILVEHFLWILYPKHFLCISYLFIYCPK